MRMSMWVVVASLALASACSTEEKPFIEPEETWPKPVFTTLEDMAVDAVILAAPNYTAWWVSLYGSRQSSSSQAISLEGANKAVRFTLYDHHLGAKSLDRMYVSEMGEAFTKYYDVPHDPDLFDGWRSRVLNLAREALKDPKDLWRIYQNHRPAVLDAIRNSGFAYETKDYLIQILPLFDGGPPNPEFLAAKQTYQTTTAVYRIAAKQEKEVGYQKVWALYEEAERARKRYQGYWEPDFVWNHTFWREFEWAERRRAEGGDALVATWGKVFQDIAESL